MKIYKYSDNTGSLKLLILQLQGNLNETQDSIFDYCLNENYFESLSEAKRIIESWRIDYNENRPQKELKGLTPNQFKTKLKSTKNSL